MHGKVSTIDVMPVANDVSHILAELYTVDHEIKDGMTQHSANYVVIRLVTIFEKLLKILAPRSMDISNNSKVEVDVTTLRAILSRQADPADTIKFIMAEIGSYQNIAAVESYFQNHKLPDNKKFILTDKEKKNLDKLFKLRHRLTHTVDKIIMNPNTLRIFYNTISKLTMHLIQAYVPLSEPFAKADAYQNLDMGNAAKKHYEETIELYQSKSPSNMHDVLEYWMACLEVGKLKEALLLFHIISKAADSPDSDMVDDDLVILYTAGGIILTDLGGYEDAAKSLDRGLEIAPDDSTLLFQMTEVQLKLGNAERALECALRTLSTPSKLITSHYWLSQVYSALGNERIAKYLRNYFDDEISKMVERESTLARYMPES